MAQIVGKVFKVFPKEWPAKKPGAKGNVTYSIKLEDDPLYYRTPRKTGGDGERFAGIAEPGNMVSFEANPVNENSAQIVGDVDLVKQPEAAATVSPAAAQGVSGAVQSVTNREASIHYQSARKDALQLVDIAVRSNAIKLPAKEAARLEALEALVDHYTSLYYQDVPSFGAVKRAAGETDGPAESKTTATGDEE